MGESKSSNKCDKQNQERKVAAAAEQEEKEAEAEAEEEQEGWQVSITKCCCVVCTTLLTMAALALLCIIIIRPQKPTLRLKQARLEGVSVQTLTNTRSIKAVKVSANVSVEMEAENPNTVVGVDLSAGSVKVLYSDREREDMPLGEARWAPFHAAPRSSVSVRGSVGVEGAVVPAALAVQLLADAALLHSLSLRFAGDVSARLTLSRLSLPRLRLALDCSLLCSSSSASPSAAHLTRDFSGAIKISTPISLTPHCSFFIDV